jgi:hypothetical protein
VKTGIEGGLESHKARLYHVNAKPVKRSTLADANAPRPVAVFAGLFSELMKRAPRGLRRSLADTVYLIDSTSLRLNALSKEWARFPSGVCGAKAHVIYDADAACPVYMAVTAAKVNDITAAQDMPSRRARPMFSTLAIMITGGGRNWTRLAARS